MRIKIIFHVHQKKVFSLYLFLPEIPVESRGNSQNDYRMDNIPVILAGPCGSFLLRRRCAEYQTLYFFSTWGYGHQTDCYYHYNTE